MWSMDFHHSPVSLPPLDNDPDQTGTASDHLIIVMRPLTNEFPSKGKRYRIIDYRPFPDSGMRLMGQWVQSQDWHEIYKIKCPNLKAVTFEKIVMEKVEQFFPRKTIRLNENDKPWVNSKLKRLDRARKREYNKKKKSEKWKKLNLEFLKLSADLKENYYKDVVEDLKESNISQWYSKVKRMSSIDSTKDEYVQVHEIMNLPSKDQAELIANKFAQIANEYEPLKSEEIEVPPSTSSKPIPLFEEHQIHKKISKMKKKASTVTGDLPWKIISEFSVEFAAPLCNIYNTHQKYWSELSVF